jgi:hypothetical protein
MLEGIPETAERAKSAVAHNPLALLGGSFALGLVTGLILPVTEVERRNIGPLRDQLVDRAQEAASAAVAQGRQAVGEAARAAMESVTGSSGAYDSP